MRRYSLRGNSGLPGSGRQRAAVTLNEQSLSRNCPHKSFSQRGVLMVSRHTAMSAAVWLLTAFPCGDGAGGSGRADARGLLQV